MTSLVMHGERRNKMNNNTKTREDEFTFEIVRHLGTLSKSQIGWAKEANIVSWRGGTPKLDIREWDPDHERMSRGITLKKDEALKLVKILNDFYGDEVENLPECDK